MFSMVLETRTGKLIKDRRENRNTRHTRKPEESLMRITVSVFLPARGLGIVGISTKKANHC